MTATMPQALQYARASTGRPWNPNWSLYLALFCGLTPTTVATIAFVGWLSSGYGGLEALGLFTVLAGVVLLPIGLVSAARHLWTSHRTRRQPVRRWLVPGAAAVGVLVGNVPLSAAYYGIYHSISGRYIVSVVNATPTAISGVVITDPAGQTLKLGPIPPGRTVQGWFCPAGEGAITLTAPSLAQPVVVEGYISGGVNGPATRTITFGPGGNVTVK